MKKLLIVLTFALVGCSNGDLQPAFSPDQHFSMPTGDINWHGGNWHHHKVPDNTHWDKLSSDFYGEGEA